MVRQPHPLAVLVEQLEVGCGVAGLYQMINPSPGRVDVNSEPAVRVRG